MPFADIKNITRPKEAIQQAITDSWKGFCETIRGDDLWTKINKITKSGGQKVNDTLFKDGQRNMLSAEESTDLLATLFFPTDEESNDSKSQKRQREESNKFKDTIDTDQPHCPFTREN